MALGFTQWKGDTKRIRKQSFLFILADTSIAATSAKRAKKRSLVLLKKKI